MMSTQYIHTMHMIPMNICNKHSAHSTHKRHVIMWGWLIWNDTRTAGRASVMALNNKSSLNPKQSHMAMMTSFAQRAAACDHGLQRLCCWNWGGMQQSLKNSRPQWCIRGHNHRGAIWRRKIIRLCLCRKGLSHQIEFVADAVLVADSRLSC